MWVTSSTVPDWVRRGVRLAVSLPFFTMLGYGILVPLGNFPYKNEFRQSCTWAAITSVVVTAPLTGKVVQQGTERITGTLAGGILGFLVYDHLGSLTPDWTDPYVNGLFSSFVGLSSAYLSWRLKLDQSTKLYAITFLLVTNGARANRGAVWVAILRTGGIVVGVLVSMILSVVLLPHSATVECLKDIQKAMASIKDLNKLVWSRHVDPASLPARFFIKEVTKKPPTSQAPKGDDLEDGTREPLLTADESSGVLDEEEYEDACELCLTTAYASLTKAKENIGLSKNEAYVGRIRGIPFFLPHFPAVNYFRKCFGPSWQLPYKDLEEMSTCLRRVAQILWVLHLDFQGFDAAMQSMMSRHFPAPLMADLARYSQGTLEDISGAFPRDSQVPDTNLRLLGEVVHNLMLISDNQRRGMMDQLSKVKHRLRPQRPFGRSQTYTEATRPLTGPLQYALHTGARHASLDWAWMLEKGAGKTEDTLQGSPDLAVSAPSQLPPNWAAALRSSSDHRMSASTPGGQQKEGPSDGGETPKSYNAVHEVSSPSGPRDDSPALLFPPTPEGYVSQVHWYSFQFLLDELVEELDELVAAVGVALAQMHPRGPR